MIGMGITPAEFEKRMKIHEQLFGKMYISKEHKDTLNDVADVLKQEGYDAGAKVLERMFVEYE